MACPAFPHNWKKYQSLTRDEWYSWKYDIAFVFVWERKKKNEENRNNPCYPITILVEPQYKLNGDPSVVIELKQGKVHHPNLS